LHICASTTKTKQKIRTMASTANKTVLITGSTRGIGLEFAKHYTTAGWRVIGAARAGSNTDKVHCQSPHVVPAPLVANAC
jgi:NAD(P)-dependent dehydrogenase (short-subunit alcohol dehydrogenase family)